MVHEMCDSPVQQDTRYDRQIRLWGDHGQTALENAHVLVAGVNTTSCEAVKSLILPGVGRITLLDRRVVDKEAISSNFFLSKSDLGRNCAEAVISDISELNPAVKMEYDDRSIEEALSSSGEEFFQRFTIVLVSKIESKTRRRLEEILFRLKIPLVLAESTGMFGRIRLFFKEHFIIEAKKDHTVPDLRLDCPFPELNNYLRSFDLSSMDDFNHKHVPMIVPLFAALEEWRNENGRAMPNFRGKKEIQKKINRLRRAPDEENFDEALAAVNTMVGGTTMPADLVNLFNQKKEFTETSLTPDSPIHWVLFKALCNYVSNNDGMLPQDPKIPDMFSDTNSFVRLSKMYREKAAADVADFKDEVKNICSSIGVQMPEDKLIARFCSNCRGANAFFGCIASFERRLPELLRINDESIHIYLLFEAALGLEKQFSRYPGTDDMIMIDGTKKDADRMEFFANKITKPVESDFDIDHDLIDEFLRLSGLELNSVATYIGGLAAQETIKLITRQFIPINNTVTYNAITEELKTFIL